METKKKKATQAKKKKKRKKKNKAENKDEQENKDKTSIIVDTKMPEDTQGGIYTVHDCTNHAIKNLLSVFCWYAFLFVSIT